MPDTYTFVDFLVVIWLKAQGSGKECMYIDHFQPLTDKRQFLRFHNLSATCIITIVCYSFPYNHLFLIEIFFVSQNIGVKKD
jgi:hypothetical protein